MTPSFRENRIVKRKFEYGKVCSESAFGHREMPKGHNVPVLSALAR